MSRIKQTFNCRFHRGRDLPFQGPDYCSFVTNSRLCHTAEVQSVFGSGDFIPGYSQTGDDARFARQVMDVGSFVSGTRSIGPSS